MESELKIPSWLEVTRLTRRNEDAEYAKLYPFSSAPESAWASGFPMAFAKVDGKWADWKDNLANDKDFFESAVHPLAPDEASKLVAEIGADCPELLEKLRASFNA